MSAISPPANYPETHGPDERMLVFGRRLSNVKLLHLCFLWSGIPLMLGIIVGAGLIAGYLPPPHPYSGAEEIAEMYRANNLSIKYGIAGSFLVLPFCIFYGTALATQTRRIEGPNPILTYFQVASFSTGFAIFVVCWITLLIAAYRPERAAAEILLVNDAAFVLMVTAYTPFSTWCLGFGLAILFDRKEDPIIPRWIGYYSIFTAISFIPDSLGAFFTEGPTSWEGLVVFYIPFITWFIWILVSIWGTTKAILNDPNLEFDRDHRALNDARARQAI